MYLILVGASYLIPLYTSIATPAEAAAAVASNVDGMEEEIEKDGGWRGEGEVREGECRRKWEVAEKNENSQSIS